MSPARTPLHYAQRNISAPAGAALVVLLLAGAAALWVARTQPSPELQVTLALAPSGATLPLTLPVAGRPEPEPAEGSVPGPPPTSETDEGAAGADVADDEVTVGAAPPPVDRLLIPPGESAAAAAEEEVGPAPEEAPESAPDSLTEAPGATAATEPRTAPEPDVAEAAEPAAEAKTAAASVPVAALEVATPAAPSVETAPPLSTLAPTWLAYARPFDAPEDRPRIAVVVAGLGLGRAATAAAIRLPSDVTLAFLSHARDLQEWIDRARAAGHEVMLDVPMEPTNFPRIDPVPHALLTSLPGTENVDRLKWHLGRATGYVGITDTMGSRFATSADALRPVLSALRVRGLIFLDSRAARDSVAARLATTIGLARAINDRFLDNQASRAAIDRRLSEVERIARETGYSVAIGYAYPVTLERLERWLMTLDEKRLALAPVSAVVNRQTVR